MAETHRFSYQTDGPIAILTLASPDGENRLAADILDAIDRGLAAADADPAIRVVILRSAEKVFSNGMDLEAVLSAAESPKAGHAELPEAIASYARVLRRLSLGRLPVIGVINAPVRAGGVGLVAACDIVIAGPAATFELSEIRFGLLPANVLPYILGWRMAPQRARYLVLTARKLSAVEALGFGLADDTVETADGLEKAVRAAVKGILRSSPRAIALAKEYTAAWASASRETAMEQAVSVLESLVLNDEVRRDLQSFQAGDLPPWFGAYKPNVPLSGPGENDTERGA